LTSPVTVLSATEIKNRNQTYIADLLRTVPGIAVNRSGPGAALTQLRMRGTEASHVLVLIDGVEVANPTAGEYDFSGIRAADIVTIEVLRGEQSALYGSDAVGGVINIITNAGQTVESWSGSVEAGSFGTLQGHVSSVIPLGNASLAISGDVLTTDGYDISGRNGEEDGSESRSLNVGLNNIALAGITLSGKYTASHLRAEFDADSPFDGVLDDTNSVTFVDTNSARLDAKFDLVGLTHVVTLSGHDITTDTRSGSLSTSDGTRRNAKWATKGEFGAHTISALAEAEKESYTITPSFAFSPTTPKNTTYAIAGDYRFKQDGIDLNASARKHFNDRFDDAFTWKIGGAYAISSLDGRIRASVGTGIKNPSLIELFGFFPENNFTGNPDLKPERSLGYDIGYAQNLLDGDVVLSADYFHSDLENEVFTDFSAFPFLARNRTTESKREGVELEGRWQMNDQFSGRASATFLDAEEDGVKELRRPEFLASGTITWDADPFSVTLSADHTGSQIDTNFATFSRVELDSFTLVGLNAIYRVNDVISVSLRGENLLDEDYQEVVGYASQGRGFYAGLRANF
jgi:vitamin B12 transporter